MGGAAGGKLPAVPALEHSFACGTEASALLNCAVGNDFDKDKCVELLLKLRQCVKRQVSGARIT